MTGTVSRTATAASRGVVGRKLQAKLWPDEQQPHRRRRRVGKRAKRLEARCHPERGDVDAAGCSEGHVSYPGRPVDLPCGLPRWRHRGMDRQESAEAIVPSEWHCHPRREGPNMGSRTSRNVRCTTDADPRAVMPGPPARVGGGTAKGSGLARARARD